MRRIASEPQGISTSDRAELLPGIRSFHIRHSRNDSPVEAVASPVRVIFYRTVAPGTVEIVRVPHERMEPSRHMPV